MDFARSEAAQPSLSSVDCGKLLSRLDSLLQDGHPLTKIPESTVIYGIHAAWLKVKVWSTDIDLENTDILRKLWDLSEPLASDVDRQLRSINELLARLEERLQHAGYETEEIKELGENAEIDVGERGKPIKVVTENLSELKLLVDGILDAAKMLSRLTDPIMDLQEELDNKGMRNYVQQALNKRSIDEAPGALSKLELKDLDPEEIIVAEDDDMPLKARGSPSRTPIAKFLLSPGAPSKTAIQDTSVQLKNLEDLEEEGNTVTSGGVALRATTSSSKEDPFGTFAFAPISKDEVRLATIEPGPSTAPLEFSIFTVNISKLSKFKYGALSHAWSFPSQDIWRTVWITDHPPLSKDEPFLGDPDKLELEIRQDTYKALERLRDKRKAINIWVDAVCLDLSNAEEKRIQSANFAEIYYNAGSMVLWLGDNDEQILDAFASVPRISQMFTAGSDFESDLSQSIPWFAALIKLMHNKVFSRRWIVQEIVLARKVTLRCGDEVLNWNTFADAVGSWQLLRVDHPKLAAETFKTAHGKYVKNRREWLLKAPVEIILDTMQNGIRRDANGRVLRSLSDLHELVVSFSGFSSWSPRDAIYAFLSLAADTVQFFQPKEKGFGTITDSRYVEVASIWREVYQMPILGVFGVFVQHCIERSGSLNILCYPWAPRGSGVLPSWMRETEKFKESHNPVIFNFARNSNQGKRIYRAAGDSKPVSRISSNSKHDSKSSNPETPEGSMESAKVTPSIFVQGFLVACIEDISARMVQGLITRECLELGGLEFSNRKDSWLPKDIPEMLWRTLVADRNAETALTGERASSLYQILFARCLNEAVNGDLDTREERGKYGGKTIEFLRAVHDVTFNRKLFRAGNDDMLGLGPAESDVGDIVCILFGCDVPVILREHLAGISPYFELIGECFAYGIMDGEAIDELGKDGLERRMFEIR